MPLCAKCRNPFVCHCSAAAAKPLGAPVLDCPEEKPPGAIWVHVTDDQGIDVENVGASNDGAIKPTDSNGVAVYDPVAPGAHEVCLSLPTVDKLKLYEEPAATARKPLVTAGEITYVAYQLLRRPALKVRVVEKGNPAKLFEGAQVSVAGAQAKPATGSAATGVADFGLVTAGDYQVKVELKDDDKKTHATTLDFATATADVTLAAGQDREVIVEAEPLNLVTPKIELEYKLVMLDRKLHDAQAVGETKVYPGATRIEVSVTQTNTDHPFTKTGKLVAPNVDVFLDEACNKALTRDLTAVELTAAKPLELWLRGKTAGKFDITLTLAADPAARFITLAAPAKEEMGVVALEIQLHEQDMVKLKAVAMQVDPDTPLQSTYHTNLASKAMPPLKQMVDADKIGQARSGDASKPGRLLHSQKDGHFSRAKLVIAKLNLAHLPAGTDDYDIVLNVGRGAAFDKGADAVKPEELQGSARDVPHAGSIELFDGETGGVKKSKASFKVSVLKGAAQTLWVEGGSESNQACDIRLDVGLDRPAGGLAKVAKRNGDWARFTVVKIESVTVVDQRQPGQVEPQRWDATNREYFVNMSAAPDGRKLKIAAKLSKPLRHVRLHVMLAESQNNRKAANWGKDLPATWTWKDISADLKHLDKANRKDFLHLAAASDPHGEAQVEVYLSRFGGDKFTPGAYIEHDAILAKYIEGHSTLEVRKPVLGQDITVMRKFWVQMIDAGTGNPFASITPQPGVVGATAQYAAVKAKMVTAPPVQLSPPPAGSLYPKSMIQAGGAGTPGLLVSNVNKRAFFATVAPAADMPVKVPIIVCDAQWDTGNPTLAVDVPWTAAIGPIAVPNARLLVKPYLDGTPMVVSGTIESRSKRKVVGYSKGPSAVLADADLNLVLNAAGNASDVTVSIPAALQTFVASHPNAQVRIVGLTMKAAEGPYLGESFDGNILSVWDASEPVDFQNTIVHELGHFFSHTLSATNVTALSANGIPPIPTHYNSFLDIYDASDNRGSGPHCHTSATPFTVNARQGYRDGKCVMFEYGPVVGSLNRYCDTCHPYMLVTDMAK